MNIREATLEDLSALQALEQNIIDSERPYHRYIKNNDATYYDIGALISNPDSQVVVVESDGDIKGSGYAQIRPSNSYFTHEQHCYLGFIYLEPELRGKALGGEIIEVLKAWGVERGSRHFHLNVYAANESAIRSYEKAGFEKVSVMMELVV